MQTEQVKKFKWESLWTIIVLILITVYYFSHRGEGTPTTEVHKAIEQVDTLSAVTDTIALDIDTLKAASSSQDISTRKNAAQLNEVVDWIRKQDRQAAAEIKRAADTVKLKEESK